jgi:hypothetical protein
MVLQFIYIVQVLIILIRVEYDISLDDSDDLGVLYASGM